jgi:hypothetical protein
MNQKEKQIQDDEAKGRAMFLHFATQNQDTFIDRYTDHKYDHYDVIFDYQNHYKLLGEIKYRNKNSDEFGEWFLECEKTKLIFTQSKKIKQNEETHTIAYINIFNDNILAMWLLTQEDLNKLTKSIKKLPKSEWDHTLVDKEVYHLRLSKANKVQKIK